MKLMGIGAAATTASGFLSHAGGQTEGGAPPGPAPLEHPENIPSAQEMFARIEEICSWGVRRSTYPAGRKAEDFCVEQFESLGLQNVRKEPVPLPVWEPLEHSLTIITDTEEIEVDCFPLPHTAGDVDLELDLALLVAGAAESVTGRAALVPQPLMKMPAKMPVVGGDLLEAINRVSQLPIHPSGTVVDPGGSLDHTVQTLPFTPFVMDVMAPAQEAGAAAFIGFLQGHPGDICEYYVPYDGFERPFPGVWIRESDGVRLMEHLARGDVSVKLRIRARREMDTGYNIVGDLPGADDEVVIIGSHHDAPWASAVEDASGMALVLAQAQYWTKVPVDHRPHSLRFLLQVGHMAGGIGNRAYIGAHQKELSRIVLEVHLEHAAREIRAGKDGYEFTGEPETRWFFTSRNPQLEKAVIDALRAENIDRSLVLAPDVFGHFPTTDGGFFHLAGVPLVNYLTAPTYLFDPLDTPDKIDMPSLVPITNATIRIVQSTAGVSAHQMRAGVVDPQD
jgi:hypothetical protein